MEKVIVRYWRAPVGAMIVGSVGGRLCLCDWVANGRREVIDRRICRRFNAEYVFGSSDVIERAIAQLTEYFEGRRTRFSIPMVFCGSPFQCRVWSELMNIPYGATISYGELARRINSPKAVRAVASANASNAMSVIVPCHRVIGSDGSLGGYSGGLKAKRALLSLEGVAERMPYGGQHLLFSD